MGNRTSKSRSSAQIKKKYFKVVEKSKREYTQRKNTFLVKLPNHDWRKSVYKDLDALENYMPDMQWPAAIRKMLVSWDILRDQRWRSNIIWFDYLNMNKVSPALPQTTSICSLERPLPSITKNELECQSFLEFFGMHLASPDTHAIAAMIIIFQREFTDTYIDKNCDTSEEPGFHITKRIQTEADVKKMIEEVHLVIDLCVESFQVYYGGIDLQTLMSERYREMRDLDTSVTSDPAENTVCFRLKLRVLKK